MIDPAKPDYRPLYAQAADLIDEYGWRQGQDGSRTIGFCAAGAIHEASGTNIRVTWAACRALSHVLGGGITWWNDRPERTKEQVTAFLREQAAVDYVGVDDDRAA